MKKKSFSIGGYNFNDWGLVKELYVPTDVSSGTIKTLHDRAKDGLEHHLQHYFVPTDKVFIAIIAIVEITTTDTIGIFGTATRFLPGGPDPGDEFIADRPMSLNVIHISKGIQLPFSVAIVGIFPGFKTGSNTMGRWLEAKTTNSIMKAGGILHGVEVDT